MPSPTGDISDDYTPVPPPTAVENLQYTSVPDNLGYTNLPPVNNQQLHNNIINNQSNNKESLTTSTPSALISPTWSQNNEGEVDLRRKKYPTDKAYFIAKELLMTERTYKKDLEVINLWFREEFSKDEELGGAGGQIPAVGRLLALFNPIHESHCAFLRDIETRLTTWETPRGQTCQRIGDVLLDHLDSLPIYETYLLEHISILEELNDAYNSSIKFQQLYRDFELQKVCSLPLNAFILKPLQRLVHYQKILDRFLGHYTNDHPDFYDCTAAKTKISDIINEVPDALRNAENLVQLIELQRDLTGFDHLVQPEREFIRQGCLMKYSPSKGYQQRMFFLFSDVLLYTNRITQPYHQFRVHGQLPLRGVMIEDGASSGPPSSPSPLGSGPELSSLTTTANFSFSIYGGNRALTVAAHSQEEKDKWLEDLTLAITQAKEKTDTRLNYLSLKSCGSSDEVIDKSGTSAITDDSNNSNNNNNNNNNNNKPATSTSQRSNTTVHVCWHRSTSTGIGDHLRAVENQLSGYLLRKFKNSNGWQKLWVVFTNFCLFFYKTFQDDFPLASLPLLGYSVTTPSEKDGIQKEFVFKLQFKNHVYFFRAESEYIFARWMDVISSATQNSKRMRLFSRQESVLNN